MTPSKYKDSLTTPSSMLSSFRNFQFTIGLSMHLNSMMQRSVLPLQGTMTISHPCSPAQNEITGKFEQVQCPITSLGLNFTLRAFSIFH